MGKGSMLYKAVKMPHNTPVRFAGDSTIAGKQIGAYTPNTAPLGGKYRQVNNCKVQQIVYHTKQIKSFRNRFQDGFRAGRGQSENICKYPFLYIFVLLGFCTDVCEKKFLKKFWFICCFFNLKEYNEIKN